jgi:spore coat protein H
MPMEEPEVWSMPMRVLGFDGVFAFTDLEEHLLLYTLPNDTISSFSPHVGFGDFESLEFEGRELKENEVNDLGEVVVNHSYMITARHGNKSHSYQLYFTNLPLLHICTDTKIPNEPKVLSWFELAYAYENDGAGETRLYTSYSGIEIRGRTSAGHEKKSYGLELWETWYGKDHSAPLLGMRYGEDWILDAMCVDPLRMRNKLSFEIWEKMWYKKRLTPFKTTHPGIQCEYVELFINQRYMGLYCLSERLDQALIKFPAAQPGSEGVLYKAINGNGGGTAFSTYNSEPGTSLIWEGWEQVFPNHLACWEPLAELRKTVVLEDDEIFTARIDTLINLDAFAEYYLFTNLILAYDNIIKNYFLARYEHESAFLILPWDLEASWGIMWHGGESSSQGLLRNNLYDRLLELDVEEFDDLLASKWESYREGIFHLDSLMAPARNYTDLLKRSGAIERENSRWLSAEIDMDQELQYLLNWMTLRLNYLDQVFD